MFSCVIAEARPSRPSRTWLTALAAAGLAWASAADRAAGQSSLADDVIAAQGDGGGRTSMPTPDLGPGRATGEGPPTIGGVEGPFPVLIPQPRAAGGAAPGLRRGEAARDEIGLRDALKSSPALAFPTQDRLPAQGLEGPVGLPIEPGTDGGLTLDLAIERLLAMNLRLQSASFALSAADAEVLTAGLRTNPLIFYGVADVPYGSFSEERPGETEHAISLVHPIDWNGKRRKRIAVARAARSVLEAQYQNVIRVEIERLGLAFVDVLADAEEVRLRRRRSEQLERTIAEARERVGRGLVDEIDLDGLVLEYRVTNYLLDEAEDALWESKLTLATILEYPPGTADRLEVVGSLVEPGPPPPPLPDLIRIALECRPDLIAGRLGLDRDRLIVDRERAERYADAFALYQPFTYQDNSAVGGRSATSWAAGVFVSVPLYDRNQGNIRRAEVDREQARIDLIADERRAIASIERLNRRYYSLSQDAERLEREILPIAEKRRDALLAMLLGGTPDTDIDDYLAAQRDYGSILRQILDLKADQRRTAIELNAAVGRRVLP